MNAAIYEATSPATWTTHVWLCAPCKTKREASGWTFDYVGQCSHGCDDCDPRRSVVEMGPAS